jgi:SAM-dependent methyltransferase
MGQLRNFVTQLHQASKRDFLARMVDDKVHCMMIAKEYGPDYWDGDRRYGYGGYKYMPGRWKPVAEALIQTYGLGPGSKVLDVGCGKGFLLHEMLLLEPGLQVSGFDISPHGINCATDLVKPHLFLHEAQALYPYADQEFDLVISLATLHNLRLPDLKVALTEIERVGKQAYVMLESYRNERELFNLQCWALTCESFFDEQEWIWLYEHLGYSGDFEFIYFE